MSTWISIILAFYAGFGGVVCQYLHEDRGYSWPRAVGMTVIMPLVMIYICIVAALGGHNTHP